MNTQEAIKKRKSVRAFQDKPVSDEQIHRILDAARFAPSGTNTQPWQVAVVQGETKEKLDKKLTQVFNQQQPEAMEYNYYPVNWVEPYLARRRACGLLMYSTLAIQREEKARMQAQWALNYTAFGAPVALYFFIDPILEKGSFMDMGMFLQSLMLAAVEEGLASCAQAALAQYPHIVKEELAIPAEKILLCGMALGYEDSSALVNQYRTAREPVESFTRFYR